MKMITKDKRILLIAQLIDHSVENKTRYHETLNPDILVDRVTAKFLAINIKELKLIASDLRDTLLM